jgi:hypothetical protein
MMKTNSLQTFWLSFPDNDNFPVGFGVTAYSLGDAYALLKANGYEFHERAARVEVREGITVAEIELNHVRNNMGPIVTRGVWYPALNIGFGAPLGGRDHA